MSNAQFAGVIASLVILLATSAAAQFGWLGNGKVKTVIVFIAGVAVIVALRATGLPPSWFSGSLAAFSLAASMLFSAFIGRTPEETSFRRPLFLGLGLSLLAVNVVRFIENIT